MRILTFLGAFAILAGCGQKQSDACIKMFECDQAWAAGDETYDGTWLEGDTTYGDGGTCWSSNAAAADACDSACVTATDGLKSGAEAAVTAENLDAVPASCE